MIGELLSHFFFKQPQLQPQSQHQYNQPSQLPQKQKREKDKITHNTDEHSSKKNNFLNEEIRDLIKKKAEQYDSTREQVVERIKGYVKTAIDSLKEVEEELLGAVDIAFEDNPFSDFLFSDNHTESETRNILSKEIRSDFGPNKEMLNNILDAIETFKYSYRKKKRVRVDPTPQNLRCTNVTCNTISVTWDEVDCDYLYEVEIESPSSKNAYRSLKLEYVFRDLKPETEYYIRVRTILQKRQKRMFLE